MGGLKLTRGDLRCEMSQVLEENGQIQQRKAVLTNQRSPETSPALRDFPSEYPCQNSRPSFPSLEAGAAACLRWERGCHYSYLQKKFTS